MTDTPTLEVLDVDQWTSTGNIREFQWDDLKRDGIEAITGGDSEAIRQITGGTLWFRQVKPSDSPSIGHVWFVRGADGKPEKYRACYDSSD